jgi:hypothetical protein
MIILGCGEATRPVPLVFLCDLLELSVQCMLPVVEFQTTSRGAFGRHGHPSPLITQKRSIGLRHIWITEAKSLGCSASLSSLARTCFIRARLSLPHTQGQKNSLAQGMFVTTC